MVSVERIMSYGVLNPEASLETHHSAQPPSSWPSKGHIEIHNMSYCHSTEGPVVLNSITCDIKSGEKVR